MKYWEKVGTDEVAFRPEHLDIIPYSCTCKNCSLKRLPNKMDVTKCFAFWCMLKRYAQKRIDKINEGKVK